MTKITTKWMIGIDISKSTLDCCVLTTDGEVTQKDLQFQNSPSGIKQLLRLARKLEFSSVYFAMEHTGHYGSLLAFLLSKEGAQFSLLNPLDVKQSLGVSRGKTDSIDAIRIALYAIQNMKTIYLYQLPAESIQRLESLLRLRDHYTKEHIAAQNLLKMLKIESKVIDNQYELQQLEDTTAHYKQKLAELDQSITTTIYSNQELETMYNKIIQVTGVGLYTASKILIETNLFKRFQNPRSFACHCGVVPFAHQSGSSINRPSRTSKMRNRDLKAVLMRSAITAIRHDVQLKQYYNRKIKEGKHKMSVINAVANKIILRIYAVANRDAPFVHLQ